MALLLEAVSDQPSAIRRTRYGGGLMADG